MESNIRVLFFLWYNKVWILRLLLHRDFRGSSVGKESACNAGDPGSGRSTGEGIGHPFQYSWTSLVARLVKNLPAMRETWVWSLGWEDPLEKGKATHSSILDWRIPWTAQFMGLQRVGHDWATFTFTLTQYTRGIPGGWGDPGIVKPGLTLQRRLHLISTCVQQLPKQNLVPGTKWNKLSLQNMKKENETYNQLRHHQILFISFSESLWKSPTVIADDWVIAVLVECTPSTNMRSQHGKHFAAFP